MAPFTLLQSELKVPMVDIHTRIYVGQTEDLSIRFDNHHKQDCFDRHNKNCICVYGEQDENNRLLIEQDLIETYGPPCNG